MDQILEQLYRDSRQEYSELEYKIKLSFDQIKTILLSVGDKKYEIEQSVNIIYDKLIHKCIFVDNILKKEEYYQKNVLLKVELDEGLFLSLATEQPIAKPTGSPNLFRIKNRISIFLDKKYRLDITQVCAVAGFLAPEVRQRRLEIFKKYSDILDYAKKLDPQMLTEIELEIYPTSSKDLHPDNLSIIPCMSDILSVREMLVSLAQLLGSSNRTLKSMLSKPSTLSKDKYNSEIYPPINWYITNKADGLRAILGEQGLLLGSKLISSKNSGHKKSSDGIIKNDSNKNGGDRNTKNSGDNNFVYFLDCEVIDKNILVFDFISTNNQTLEERIQEMKKIKLPIIPGYSVELKHYFHITDLNVFREIRDYKFEYLQDGYILSSNDRGYKRSKHYKIKAHQTIDFMVKKVPKKFFGGRPKESTTPIIYKEIKGKNLYVLFCGINGLSADNLGMRLIPGYNTYFPTPSTLPGRKQIRTEYMPIQFSPPDRPLSYFWYTKQDIPDAMIVELEPIFKDHIFIEWKFHKLREDRVGEPNYFGNDFIAAAEPNWRIAQDSLTITEMSLPIESYFSQKKGEIYAAQTGFISFCKTRLIETASELSPNKFVIDLAAGKGQDLLRYPAYFDKGLFLDIDRIAISSLMARRYNLIKKNLAIKFQTFVGVEDLTKPKDEILGRLAPFLSHKKAGFVNCNLAIHYLISDLHNFCGLVSQIIAKNGVFAFTTFDGEKINSY